MIDFASTLKPACACASASLDEVANPVAAIQCWVIFETLELKL